MQHIQYFNELYNSEKYSDIILILTDENQSKKLSVHKNIISMIPLFEMLIRNNKTGIIDINVPDVDLSEIIIQSCYQIFPKIEKDKMVRYMKCCHYMMIERNYNIPDDVVIGNEKQYDELVELSCELELDNIDLLIEKLPKNYPLNKLSRELLSLMKEKSYINPLIYFRSIDGFDLFYPIKTKLEPNLDNINIIYWKVNPDKIFGYRIIFSHNRKLAIVHDCGRYDFEKIKFVNDQYFASLKNGTIRIMDISLNEIYNRHGQITDFDVKDGCVGFIEDEIDMNKHYVVVHNFYTGNKIWNYKKYELTRNHLGKFRIHMLKNKWFTSDLERLFELKKGKLSPSPYRIDANKIYCKSCDNQYIAFYEISEKRLVIMSSTLLIDKIISVPESIIYFSEDNKYLIFRHANGYNYVSFDHNYISDLMDGTPEKKYDGLKSELTILIEQVLE